MKYKLILLSLVILGCIAGINAIGFGTFFNDIPNGLNITNGSLQNDLCDNYTWCEFENNMDGGILINNSRMEFNDTNAPFDSRWYHNISTPNGLYNISFNFSVSGSPRTVSFAFGDNESINDTSFLPNKFIFCEYHVTASEVCSNGSGTFTFSADPGLWTLEINPVTRFYDLYINNTLIQSALNFTEGMNENITFFGDSGASSNSGIYTFHDKFQISDGLTEFLNTFNSTTFETSLETFIINMSYVSSDWTSISSNLIYNGTSFLGTKSGSGDNLEFTRSINVPPINGASQNLSFVWEFVLTNSTGTFRFNSSTQVQSVDEIIFQDCNATLNEIVVNFTIIDEGNRSPITATMGATFEYNLGGTEFNNFTFQSSTDSTSYAFCTNINKTFTVDSTIRLTKVGYAERTFEFEADLFSNDTTFRNLSLLNESEGSNIIIRVVDPGLQELVGYFVDIQRFYPETNEFITVISDETDDFGQFVARLIENTVKYRFIFKNPSGTIVKTTDKITIACRTTICVLPFVIEDTTDDFDRFDNITDFDSTLSFDNVTNIFTVSWNDLTGDVITYRLLVERVLINGTTTVCNTTSTSSASSMTCNVGGQRASYRSQFFRRVVAEDEKRILLLNIKVGDISVSIFGKEGLIWVFFILFTLIAVGSFNPTVGAILYFVGFIGMGLIGIISFNPAIFFANLVLVIIFIWAFRG